MTGAARLLLAGAVWAAVEWAVRLPRVLDHGVETTVVFTSVVLALNLLLGGVMAGGVLGLARTWPGAGRWAEKMPRTLSILGALGLAVFSLFIFPRSYERPHFAADLALFAALAWSLPTPGRRLSIGVGVAGALGLVVALLAGTHPGVGLVREVGVTSHRVGWAVDWLVDRDGDGYPADWWLGGADCDDGDPDVGPHGAEIPGNARDENCIGGPLETGPAPTLPAPPNQATAQNLVLITLCTFRALPIDGEADPLRAVAERAVVFRNNRSQSAASFASINSFATGSLFHRVRKNPGLFARWHSDAAPLDLPRLLNAEGFRTAFFHHGLRKVGPKWTALSGLSHDDQSESLVPAALAWVKAGAGQRFALWFHLNYPHGPSWDLRPDPMAHSDRREDYLAGRARVEQAVSALVDGMVAAGRLQDTAIVVLADHGEAFGEHVWYYHGSSLYEEMIRTPLMFAAPGIHPAEVKGSTGNLSMLPTVMDLLGLPTPAHATGSSLLPVLRGGALPSTSVISEAFDGALLKARSLVSADGRWKLLLSFSPASRALYDLQADPGERRNLWLAEPAIRDELLSLMDTAYVAE